MWSVFYLVGNSSKLGLYALLIHCEIDLVFGRLLLDFCCMNWIKPVSAVDCDKERERGCLTISGVGYHTELLMRLSAASSLLTRDRVHTALRSFQKPSYDDSLSTRVIVTDMDVAAAWRVTPRTRNYWTVTDNELMVMIYTTCLSWLYH